MPSGITIISEPTDYGYLPAYNPNWIIASSSNYAAANFKYTLIIEDILTGTIWTEQIAKDPSNLLKIDIGTYAEKFMEHYLPINVYGWKKCAGASRKIRYNVGETYGSTPVYTAGTDKYYIAWNAGVDLLDVLDYSVNAYVYDSTIPNQRFLTTTGSCLTYEDRSQFLYALVQYANLADLPSIKVITYNSAGSVLGQYTIARPDYSTGLYTDQYVCIDVGYKGMLNITNPEVTVVSGTYPIITSSVASYVIKDGTDNSIIKTITIDCSPKFTVHTLHYRKANGAYETLHCKLASEESLTTEQSTFKKDPWSYNSVTGLMELAPSLDFEKTQGVTIQNKLKVTSDWLTDTELEYHADLFTSTDVKLDLGKNNRYIKVKVSDKNYSPRNEDKLRLLVINLEHSHQNNRQRG